MSNKKRFPDKLQFHFMGFDWDIIFLDIENDNFGETDRDKKTVTIFYKSMSDQNAIETLIHELGHVVMFELADPVFKHEVDKPFDMEENLIRLTSPRLFAILRDNHHLMNFIVRKIKELDK